MKYLYYLLLILFSCSPSESKFKLKAKQNLVYKTGFISGNIQIEEIENKEYLCFGDFNTHKKIMAFPFKDTLPEFQFDLLKVTNDEGKVLSYEIINKDSAYLMLKKSNVILLINRQGDVLKRFNFDSILNNSLFSYTILRNRVPFLLNDSTFLFSLQFNRFNSRPNSVEEFIEQKRTASNLVKINLDDSKIQFEENKLYKRFSAKNDFTSEAYRYSYLNNELFFNSYFVDSVYQMNPKTLLVEEIYAINSDFIDIGLRPLKVAELSQPIDKQRNIYQSGGYIKNIFFDKNRNVFYCIVMHKSSDKVKPWSIIVLNTEFKKMDEFKMDETKYSPGAVMTSNGLLISSYYESLESNKNHFTENTFTLYQYE